MYQSHEPEGDSYAFQVLDESHQKYKFMEKNLMARRRKLKSQVPDINSSLAMLKKLKSKNEEGEEAETQFLLSDQVYAKATIPPTEKVWSELMLTLQRNLRCGFVE